MTKKLLSLFVAALMALSLAQGALAEAWVIEEAGITIQVPAGLQGQDESGDGYYMLFLVDPNEENVSYAYTVFYEEGLEGVWFEDLEEEDMTAFIEVFAGEGDWYYVVSEHEGIVYAVVTNTPTSEVHVATLLNGWLCIASGYAADGYTLEEGAIADMDSLLAGISFGE